MKSSQFLSIPSSSSKGTGLSECFNDSSILFHHSVDLNTTSHAVQKSGESPGSDYILVGDLDDVNKNGSSGKSENWDDSSVKSSAVENRNDREPEYNNSTCPHQSHTSNGYTWQHLPRNGNSRNGLNSCSFSGANNSKPIGTISKEINSTDNSIHLNLGQSISHKLSNLFHNNDKSQMSAPSPPSNTSSAPKRSSIGSSKSFLSTFTNSSLNRPSTSSTSTARATTSSSSNESLESVQNRLRSMWNNMRYGWTIQLNSNFDLHTPISLLGIVYEFTSSTNSGHRFPEGHDTTVNVQVKRFYHDYASRLWFTYRHSFPILPFPTRLPSHSSPSPTPKKGMAVSTGLHLGASLARRSSLESDRRVSPALTSRNNTVRTSDSGWGCMLRCGQMLMAQAFILHFLSRSWRIKESDLKPAPSHTLKPSTLTSTCPEEDMHRTIIRWFGDSPSTSSPFSIHNLLKMSGKEAGDWFGPASVCELLKKALHSAYSDHQLLQQLDTYVAMDRQIYVEDIRSLFCTQQSHHSRVTLDDLKNDTIEPTKSCCSRAVILFIPLYLGNIKGFQEDYFATPLLEMFRDCRFVGFLGGRPRHSLYFLGFQGRELIYLDPHFTQPVVDMASDSFSTESFHCRHPRKMHMSRIDPSCAAGFYCRSPKDLYFLLCNIKCLRSRNISAYPLTEIISGNRPKYYHSAEQDSETPLHSASRLTNQSVNDHTNDSKSQVENLRPSVKVIEQHKDNEFVLL